MINLTSSIFFIISLSCFYHNSVSVPGTKHFLLVCNVRSEDAGEIKFVARHVESVAHLQVEGKSWLDKILVLLFQCSHIIYCDMKFIYYG